LLAVAYSGCDSYHLLDKDDPRANRPRTDGGPSISTDGGPSVSSDGGPSGVCAPDPGGRRLVFCDDFEGEPFGSKWSELGTLGRRSTERSRSPSTSFFVAVETDRDMADVFKTNLDVSGTSDLSMEVDMFIERSSAILPFGLFCGDKGHTVALDMAARIAENGDTTGFAVYPMQKLVPSGTWTRVAMIFRRSRSTIELSVDGAVSVPETKLRGTAADFSGPCRFLLGLYFAPAQTSWAAYYDDIRITEL